MADAAARAREHVARLEQSAERGRVAHPRGRLLRGRELPAAAGLGGRRRERPEHLAPAHPGRLRRQRGEQLGVAVRSVCGYVFSNSELERILF